MDDDMLKLAVGEQGPQEEAGLLARQEGILFKDVLSLQLDFQSAYPGVGGIRQVKRRDPLRWTGLKSCCTYHVGKWLNSFLRTKGICTDGLEGSNMSRLQFSRSD